jgi:negative regulator of sigma E activity
MAGYARVMVDSRSSERLDETARAARLAEACGNDAAAGEAWHRYRLIRDGARDPDDLLAEGIALSECAIELAASCRTSR